ncbi:MAG: hypothetical protein PVH03_13175 [Chloroflexota bacterium]|jgi:hypothetical protein
MDIETIRAIGIATLVLLLTSLLLGVLLLLFYARRIRSLKIPDDATFVETLHYTPLLVAIAIDLLDLGLDILAAPLSWVILDWLGLKALRGVATVEALIPGTQIIPTMTLCWLGVRLLGIRY